ncbi:MAG TPA: hypothetical protein VJ933_06755, partial [Phaeodactylibacter sp.]|nr:hypothetical protein [Phaeodactylibacter sp.]
DPNSDTPTIAAFAIPGLPQDDASVQSADQPNTGSMNTQTAALSGSSSEPSLAAALPRQLAAASSASPGRAFAQVGTLSKETFEAQPTAEVNTTDAAGGENSGLSTAPSTITLLSELPRREVDLLSEASLLPALPETPSDLPSNFIYGVEASLGSATFEALQGGAVAAFAQIPIGTASAWYARASIGYQQLWQSHTAAEQSFLFNSTRMANNAEPLILQSSVQVRELAYLYLLPQIGYAVHPRLSVEGGVQYGYLLRSQSATEWSVVGTPQTPTPIDNEEEDLLSRLPRNLISDEPAVPLRSAHWALQLGLRYRLNRYFSVSAQWQQGLTNIYQGDKRTAYNRYGHLGLAYRLP